MQNKDLFSGYENGYIGDIDILLCKEKIDLETQHLNHCQDIKLCYSNSIRSNSKRLSGLHFFKIPEYYSLADNHIKKYRNLLDTKKFLNKKNEGVLYNIINEANIGFSSYWFRPHHGLHLRLWQKETPNLKPILKDDDYYEYFKYFLKLEKTDLYKELFDIDKIIEIYNMKAHFKRMGY